MTCKCGNGGFRIHGHNWVILTRRPWPGTCEFKCLACGWKWWARRRYAERLRDHRERPRSGMTDADILDRIAEASLDVDLTTGEVFAVQLDGFCRPLTTIRHNPPREHGNGRRGEYRFVKIGRNGRQKKIAVHRLVWMFANCRTVPEGFDVDHVNGKSVEHPDAISNLRIMESSRNRARGYVGSGPTLFDDAPF